MFLLLVKHAFYFPAYLVDIALGEFEVFYRELQAFFLLLRTKTKSKEGGNINSVVGGEPAQPALLGAAGQVSLGLRPSRPPGAVRTRPQVH